MYLYLTVYVYKYVAMAKPDSLLLANSALFWGQIELFLMGARLNGSM